MTLIVIRKNHNNDNNCSYHQFIYWKTMKSSQVSKMTFKNDPASDINSYIGIATSKHSFFPLLFL